MHRNLLSFVVAALISGALDAQQFTLSASPLMIGQPFGVQLSGGGANAPLHLLLDQSPGPIQVASLGSVQLGFTPALYAITWLSLDNLGGLSFTSSVHADPAYTGNMVYAQAASLSPTAPGGAVLSNPLAQGFHPAPCGAGALTALNLGEDSAEVVALPFAFPFYGQIWTQVGISSNGLLTFGGISIDPTEQVGDFISGLPKVAVLWDDLSPQVQGSVSVCATSNAFQVSWTGVPQFYLPDNNNAVVTLYPSGAISMTWPGIELADSLVGIAPGSLQGALSVANFSGAAAYGNSNGSGPLFESFLPCCNPFDLHNRRVSFVRQGAGYRWVR
ncbi:MAG: hypothetical protein EXS14_07225 [Planctomycetes bacterium]|nr:hypothetical protein [Planctomycetota bacterium]